MSTATNVKRDKIAICPGCSCEVLLDYSQCLTYRTKQNAISTMPTHIATCNQCEIKFAIPRCLPNEIDLLYERGGYWKKYSENIFTLQKAPGQFIQSSIRWRFTVQYSEDQLFDILDIGAGYGFLGQAAYRLHRQKLHSYTVVEKDAYFLKSLQMTWNSKFSDIKFNAYSDLTSVKGKFNIIVLSHVLEHVVNPIDYLKLVNNLLVENGILYIEVPFLDYQYKGDFFPHLLFFKPQSLQNLCNNVGFKVMDVQSFGKSKEKSPLNYRNEMRIDVRLFNSFKGAIVGEANVNKEKIPSNFENRGKIKFRLFGLLSLINKKRYLRKFVPWKMYGHIISFYYGYKKRDLDGTWIRLVASK